MKKSLPLCAAGCWLFTRIWVRKVFDADRIPPKGKVVFACNHTSLLDGLILDAQMNWLRKMATPTIAYEEPFRHWFFGYILRSGRCIPFDRGNGESIQRMLQVALGWLKMEQSVAIFPEGHLGDGTALRFPRPGAALLALESGAPILPLGLRGVREAFPIGGKPRFKHCVTFHVGRLIDTAAMSEAYHNSGSKERAKLVQELSLQMMRQISDLSATPLHRRMR